MFSNIPNFSQSYGVFPEFAVKNMLENVEQGPEKCQNVLKIGTEKVGAFMFFSKYLYAMFCADSWISHFLLITNLEINICENNFGKFCIGNAMLKKNYLRGDVFQIFGACIF